MMQVKKYKQLLLFHIVILIETTIYLVVFSVYMDMMKDVLCLKRATPSVYFLLIFQLVTHCLIVIVTLESCRQAFRSFRELEDGLAEEMRSI